MPSSWASSAVCDKADNGWKQRVRAVAVNQPDINYPVFHTYISMEYTYFEVQGNYSASLLLL